MKELKINFDGKDIVLHSNQDGMFDLNDIWRQAGLEEKKRPSEWKSEIKEALLHSEKIRSVNGGVNRGTWATEQSVYAYAMFISTEFYVAVVEAFTLLVQGKTEEALDTATSFVVTEETK